MSSITIKKIFSFLLLLNAINLSAQCYGTAPSDDFDCDGIINSIDIDDDNDGIADSTDGFIDTDGDGKINAMDLDSDNDGVADVMESFGSDNDTDGIYGMGTPTVNATGEVLMSGTPVTATITIDTDGDNLPNSIDLDSDNDGVFDVFEAGNGNLDSDFDGIVNGIDTDGDGIINTPNIDNNNSFGGLSRPAEDTDGDGIPNYLDLDSDNDAVYDVTENGFSAFDTDGNGMLNGTDADNDGIVDLLGIDLKPTFGGETIAPANLDGDTRPNYVDVDSDNDGITDLRENGNSALDTNNDGMIDGTDADMDGVLSSVDTNTLFGAPTQTIVNTDNTGNGNYLDIDSDNDGIVDVVEAQDTFTAISALSGTDADNDGLDDAFELAIGTNTVYAGSGLLPVNTDGTDTPDYIDIDSDNDGDLDAIEGWDTIMMA